MISTIKKYFLGVDVGGTKTQALISDSSGCVVGFGVSGKGNWESVGLEGLLATLQVAINQALTMADLKIEQLAGAGFGLAGYDWPSQRNLLLGALKHLGLKCPFEIVNDAMLGIFAGTTQGWGVSVVSGTGCNCRGLSKDRIKEGRMVGGEPHWSGEYAGGMDITLRALQAVTFEWNKRGPVTALSRAFLQKKSAKDLDDLIEGLYTQKYSIDPADLFLVFEAAAQGDAEALSVLRWAGNQLGQMACGVIHQLGFETEPVQVVLIGKVYDGHPMITTSLNETILEIAPKAQLVRLKAPPAVGGILLAMEQVIGMDAYLYQKNVVSSIESMVLSK